MSVLAVTLHIAVSRTDSPHGLIEQSACSRSSRRSQSVFIFSFEKCMSRPEYIARKPPNCKQHPSPFLHACSLPQHPILLPCLSPQTLPPGTAHHIRIISLGLLGNVSPGCAGARLAAPSPLGLKICLLFRDTTKGAEAERRWEVGGVQPHSPTAFLCWF